VTVTGIVAALTAEARTLGPLRAHPGAGAVDPLPIGTLRDGSLLIISGMGPQAATRAARALVAAGAGSLLSFGLAGALDPRLQAGAMLLPDAVTDGSGAVHRTCAPWRERLAARVDAAAAHHAGTLLSLTQPLMSASAKAEAWARTHACAVDMESFAIAAVAVQQQINFAIARVVVDTAVDDLPRSVTQATDLRGEVNYLRLISGLLRSPNDLFALLRLARRYRVAMGVLRDLGQGGLGSP
jgi:adenosylhomocysteine nucleosidase